MAREGWNLLSGILRSFLNAWSKLLQPGAKDGFCGCSVGRWRWGEVFTILWINWKMPVTCWRLGEGVWMLGRAGGGLWWKIGIGRIFWQKAVTGV